MSAQRAVFPGSVRVPCSCPVWPACLLLSLSLALSRARVSRARVSCARVQHENILHGPRVAWCTRGTGTTSSPAARSPGACTVRECSPPGPLSRLRASGAYMARECPPVWPPGTCCVRRGRTSSSLAAGSPVCAPRWNVLLQLLNSFLYLLLPVCGVCLSVCATVPDTEVTHRRSQLSEHSAQWRSHPHRAVRSSPCFALGHSLPSETVACLPASRSVGSHSPASRLCASARCARRVHTVSRLGSPREAPLQNVLPWWHASARPSSL